MSIYVPVGSTCNHSITLPVDIAKDDMEQEAILPLTNLMQSTTVHEAAAVMILLRTFVHSPIKMKMKQRKIKFKSRGLDPTMIDHHRYHLDFPIITFLQITWNDIRWISSQICLRTGQWGIGARCFIGEFIEVLKNEDLVLLVLIDLCKLLLNIIFAASFSNAPFYECLLELLLELDGVFTPGARIVEASFAPVPDFQPFFAFPFDKMFFHFGTPIGISLTSGCEPVEVIGYSIPTNQTKYVLNIPYIEDIYCDRFLALELWGIFQQREAEQIKRERNTEKYLKDKTLCVLSYELCGGFHCDPLGIYHSPFHLKIIRFTFLTGPNNKSLLKDQHAPHSLSGATADADSRKTRSASQAKSVKKSTEDQSDLAAALMHKLKKGKKKNCCGPYCAVERKTAPRLWMFFLW
ncbi:hypothetical protein VP01_4036g1 [Puccinia sorghi]|uniref:Uncharacterized protein n=1 Tax=Puccinia sorghi TaxID=27349 RepID=A0A0L6UTM4_9BASI|nr:hypothetical protein VP01_4036g1 [Puccinia sorghi]